MNNTNSENLFTVGELSKMAGISVRTLQYYDRYGLLTCSHSDGGRRVYRRGDLIRLQQILFLKSFGFSLSQIRDRLIDINTGAELAKLLEAQKEAITCQIAGLTEMTNSLDSIITDVRNCDEIGADQFVAIAELAKMNVTSSFILHYLSENQLDKLNNNLGNDEQLKEQNLRTKQLMSELLHLYKIGADPKGQEGQRLASEFWKMTIDFSGGDPEMIKSFMSMGVDSGNWPIEVKEFGDAVGEFMSIAMYDYLSSIGVPLDAFSANESL